MPSLKKPREKNKIKKPRGFPGDTSGKEVKNAPTNAGDTRDWGSILGQEDLLEKGMATHFSSLAWKIPWTVEPDGLQSRGCKESDMTEVT